QQFLARLLAGGGLALQFENRVADLQTGALGLAGWGNGADRHGTVKVARGRESGVSHVVRNLIHAQTDRTEKVIPRNLVGPCDILREEPAQIGVTDSL